MALTTVFLGVLILSLLMGNALLFFFGSKKGTAAPKQNLQDGINSPSITQQDDANVHSQFSDARRLIPIETKIELAHRRIQDLEQKSQSSKSNGEALGDEALRRKIEKLDSFRSIAESELIGIKEILVELQNSNMTVKARTYKKQQPEKDIPGEKMRKMIYRSPSP